MSEMIRVASLAELPDGGAVAVKVNGHAVALFRADGAVRAVDNRCPHMAYPLVEATVKDGVLRCPWHHWRFELRTGGCLTAGGDDVGTYDVEVRGDDVLVASEPRGASLEARRERGRRDLQQGLRETNTFLIAKALCALRAAQIDDAELLREVVQHGLRFRDDGFGPGLVILTSLLNLQAVLPSDDRLLALVHGVTHVARDSANRVPRRQQRPLPDHDRIPAEELLRTFRFMCEDREAAGAERLILTALHQGHGARGAAAMLLTAATDHFFLSIGHVLDFLNKGLELLDHLGEQAAPEVLGSLVRPITGGRRHEEAADWIDWVAPLNASFARLADRPPVAPGWSGGDALRRVMLDGEPPDIVAALDQAVAAGASSQALATTLARAGVMRVARFHLQNENDWDDVLHLVSYAHAVERLAARLGGEEPCETALLKAVYHGAGYCWLTRFLNIPAVRLPGERRHQQTPAGGPDELCSRLLTCAEFQQVEEAAEVVWHYLQQGFDPAALQATLVKALLREDSVFHTFQMVECGIRRHGLEPEPEAAIALVAAARYVTAQKLRRGIYWSTKNALTLARGERLDTATA